MTDTNTAPHGALDMAALVARLNTEHVADNVEEINKLEPEEAAALLQLLPQDTAFQILDKPELDFGAEIIDALPRDVAAIYLAGMSSDMAADLVQLLDEPVRADLMQRLDAATRQTITGLLSYPDNTAGAMMTTEFVSVPGNWTVAQVMQHIRQVERTRETVYAIYVLESVTRRLIGAVTLRRLIAGESEANIMTVAALSAPITTSPLIDREDVARLITKYDLLAVPVLDKSGHVLGIVTVDDIIDAIIEENTEDVQKFGGMTATDEPYMQLSMGAMLKKRGGWLGLLFLSEMLTASVMQHFEGELEKAIVLTLFIPLIMSSGGNSGSQATSLLIRALALREVKLGDWWRVAMRELPTGPDPRYSARRHWFRPRLHLAESSASMIMASTGCSWVRLLPAHWSASSLSARLSDRCCRSFCKKSASIRPAPPRLSWQHWSMSPA